MVGPAKRFNAGKNSETPEKLDLGNNFIRRGTGLPRTPPRKNSVDELSDDDDEE